MSHTTIPISPVFSRTVTAALPIPFSLSEFRFNRQSMISLPGAAIRWGMLCDRSRCVS